MSLKKVHRHSWVSLVICWIIWVVVAYDRELIFRAANMICNEFNLSPTQWGYTIAAITLSLAVLSIPVAALSDKHASGWKRGIFQWPLVIGFTFISLLSGITSLSSSFYKFVTLRIMVSLGCGVAEPVGVSNTAEWWPKEHRGFAIGRSSLRLSGWERYLAVLQWPPSLLILVRRIGAMPFFLELYLLYRH